MSSRGQPARGGHPAFEFGVEGAKKLSTVNKISMLKNVTQDLNRLFGNEKSVQNFGQ
jgi:hypothetical protein